LTSQNEEKVIDFYWELEANDSVISVTDKQMNQILDAEARNIKLVRIGDNVINLSYVKDIKKIYKQEPKIAKDFLDWSDMGKKVVSDEKAVSNRQKIMNEIRVMLKAKNKDWKPNYKDPIHKEAVADVWLHLKSVLSTLEFPIKDDSWKLDPSITKHKDGSTSHSVGYYTKAIDLGDKYDDKFWAEANYIHCPVCKRDIRKQIIIVNDYESESIVREL
jgi:hypothetical protein